MAFLVRIDQTIAAPKNKHFKEDYAIGPPSGGSGKYNNLGRIHGDPIRGPEAWSWRAAARILPALGSHDNFTMPGCEGKDK